MKCRVLIYALAFTLVLGSLQAQSNIGIGQDYFIVIKNVRIVLGMQISKLESIKELFINSEKLHKDYGPLTWKSSEDFVPDSNYDILIYTNRDIEIQAYRGRGKVNLIKLKSDRYHICGYWIGKKVNVDTIISKSSYRNDNVFIIPVFDKTDEVGILQITLISDKIDQLILTSRL